MRPITIGFPPTRRSAEAIRRRIAIRARVAISAASRRRCLFRSLRGEESCGSAAIALQRPSPIRSGSRREVHSSPASTGLRCRQARRAELKAELMVPQTWRQPSSCDTTTRTGSHRYPSTDARGIERRLSVPARASARVVNEALVPLAGRACEPRTTAIWSRCVLSPRPEGAIGKPGVKWRRPHPHRGLHQIARPHRSLSGARPALLRRKSGGGCRHPRAARPWAQRRRYVRAIFACEHGWLRSAPRRVLSPNKQPSAGYVRRGSGGFGRFVC